MDFYRSADDRAAQIIYFIRHDALGASLRGLCVSVLAMKPISFSSGIREVGEDQGEDSGFL